MFQLLIFGLNKHPTTY